MTLDCKQLVSSYLALLGERTVLLDIGGGVCEITTPFLDRHNDRLQVYLREADGRLSLTDDGYILGDLAASGCAVSIVQRRRILQSILNGFGVSELDGALRAEMSVTEFPRKMHGLIQAMLAVNDMYMTGKQRVASLFMEDIADFLAEIQARFTQNISFTGRSGFAHRFDFVIPKSGLHPERVVQGVNNPTRVEVEGLLFAWNDTREARPDESRLYAVLNDESRGDEGRPTVEELGPDIVSAFERYQVRSIPWSQRRRFAPELAA